MLNKRQEFITGSGHHYDARYGPAKDKTWKINFFATTESSVLPVFHLPSADILHNKLGVKEADILAITSAGQILDYAALLQMKQALGRLDLTDFNPYQNLYVAYFLTQLVLAHSSAQNLKTRLIHANPHEIYHLMQNEAVDLFPELAACQKNSAVSLPELVKSLQYQDLGIPRLREKVNLSKFSSHTFSHYFLNHTDLAKALTDIILAGKIHFHQAPIEQFSNLGDYSYNLIYLSDVAPHLTDLEINSLLLMLEARIADSGIILENGFGTNCLSIASGEAVWDNRFLSAASQSTLQTISEAYPWFWENEKRVKTLLGYAEDADKSWETFRNLGPYGLHNRQDRPILLMKPFTAMILFPDYF